MLEPIERKEKYPFTGKEERPALRIEEGLKREKASPLKAIVTADELNTILEQDHCVGVRFYTYRGDTVQHFKNLSIVGINTDREELEEKIIKNWEEEETSALEATEKVTKIDRPSSYVGAYFSKSVLGDLLKDEDDSQLIVFLDTIDILGVDTEGNPTIAVPEEEKAQSEDEFSRYYTFSLVRHGAQNDGIVEPIYQQSAAPCPPDCGGDIYLKH